MKSRFWMASAVVLLAATSPTFAQQTSLTPEQIEAAKETCANLEKTRAANGYSANHIAEMSRKCMSDIENSLLHKSVNETEQTHNYALPTSGDAFPYSKLAVLAAVALIIWAVWYLLGWQYMPKGLRPLSADDVQTLERENFKGFAVPREAFLVGASSELVRINSSGLRVPLLARRGSKTKELWCFDSDSGEFFKRSKEKDGHFLVEKVPYSKRIVAHVQESRVKKIASSILLLSIFMPILIYTALSGIKPDSQSVGWAIFYLIALTIISSFVFMGVSGLMDSLNKERNHAWNIGPEPLDFKIENFGPIVDGMPGTGEAVPLDEYTPNA